MKSTLALGITVLLALPVACSHSAPHPVSSIEAATRAREEAAQKARARAAALDSDRQQLDGIPLPSKNVYMGIHTRQSWTNPFLIVSKSSVSLSILYPDYGPAHAPGDSLLRPVAARRRVLELRLSDLPEALVAAPENVWPYGRVIAVEEDPTAPPADRPQLRRNLEFTEQTLSDLGIVVYDWPSPGTH
ncbi:MAG TPA: hypothetical protein VHX37_17465 [Acidobacteriaceae bacterium]|jgi:hypothetical protein|nr:hypothetical protein [Acidobacteriaceae bacterium]